MGDNTKHDDPESEPAIDDLDVPSEDAADVVGGLYKPPETPPTPPGVPIPYPNVSGPKR